MGEEILGLITASMLAFICAGMLVLLGLGVFFWEMITYAPLSFIPGTAIGTAMIIGILGATF
jgi:hypothetical protein